MKETRIKLAKLYESDPVKFSNYKFRYDECIALGELEVPKEEKPAEEVKEPKEEKAEEAPKEKAEKIEKKEKTSEEGKEN